MDADDDRAEAPPPEIVAWLQAQLRQAEHMRRFGHVPRPICADIGGYRLVQVGSRLCRLRNCKTFWDFLRRYVLLVLGREWHVAEREKPRAKWHPVVQWDQAVRDFYQRNSEQLRNGQVFSAIATGPVMAHAALAYDLYVLEQRFLLNADVVDRLKNVDQFQGARYEVYVTASFVRAGFDVQPEDERDGRTSHCEFMARHRSGASYSVEAKSRHREGVLGREGTAPSCDAIFADVARLLVHALRKTARHERIVFIDVNVPPHEEPVLKSGWFRHVAGQLKRLEETLKGPVALPPAFVFFTNHPYHYVDPERTEPGKSAVFTAIHNPDFKRQPDEGAEEPDVVGSAMRALAMKYPALKDLSDSVFNHTKIPQAFEGDDAWCPPGTS